MDKKITDSIIYIGVDDKDIDLFESQYVVPNGVSYNSYVIMDDKIAIMDTADARVTDKWFANLREALGDRKLGELLKTLGRGDTGAGSCFQYPEGCRGIS